MFHVKVDENAELRTACQKALGDDFLKFFTLVNETSTTKRTSSPTVEDAVEYTFFQYIDTFRWGVNISGVDKEHSLSDLKTSMITNTYLNPPGLSHQAAGRARLSLCVLSAHCLSLPQH